ncbi:sulfite reductase flavoprotein subunit alpha [Pseudoxanthomonas sp. GM95]|uniref:sulfite reductase flavoprotein subunit alpha n=1 Tax=Pseudoxanthomonas sp. GM95 TaxID=1881043 RepID=UPI000B87F0C0|nr:sulfite reductase flavoprotein subunit alpha [Pseudoxanthomonas sp. GM95]
MLKNILFQLHWFLGITAGTVLAVMGISGATLSFEDELVHWTTPAMTSIAAQQRAGATPLAFEQLVQQLRPKPDTEVTRFNLDPSGERLSSIRFKGVDGSVYFDPYTGKTLAEPTLTPVLQFMEDLHRRLVAGEVGKQITGVCVITLVFFCLSGLYLRWPRRWWSPREWWQVQWKRTGRSFLWSLHSVIGTWCMVFYLMIALTGLYWSYDWYRKGFVAVLGGEQRNEGRPAGKLGKRVDLAAIQQALDQTPALAGVAYELRFPNRPGAPLNVRFRQDSAPHPRAFDSVELDPSSGQVVKQTQYADQPLGRQLVTSVFALHSGSFFGLPGRVLVMLASLCMPLFFVTGWMLYLDRRRKKREVALSRGALAPMATGDGTPWLVAFASQSGFAEQLAWRAAGQLQAAGMPAEVRSLAQLKPKELQDKRNALLVLSTFGDGEPPDTARAFDKHMREASHRLEDLRYAVLALGDRQYDRFCGFALQVEQWLAKQGAAALFPTVQVDAADDRALTQWQRHLSDLTGVEHVFESSHEPLQAWRLAERTLLNPGSVGGEVWHLRLAPPQGVTWQAGDILRIQPHNSEASVLAALARDGLSPEALVQHAGHAVPLIEAAAQHALPPRAVAEQDAEHWLAHLPLLAEREYSIASAPVDGLVDLVVRLVTHDDGQFGIGSGWLGRHAPLGGIVHARVRSNAGFHRVLDRGPMILIGNGTGIAGLRSLLRDADAAGHRGHWLLFGERNEAHDLLFGDELDQWRASGHLARLDLAYSRDAGGAHYVQDLLEGQGEALLAQLDAGAVIHVCGSAVGMAQAVDQALRTLVGESPMDHLLAEGRYRRDVY